MALATIRSFHDHWLEVSIVALLFLSFLQPPSFSLSVSAADGPDLYLGPQDITFGHDELFIGDHVDLSINISNAGGEATNITVQIELDGDSLDVFVIKKMTSRKTTEVRTWDTSGVAEGTHEISVNIVVLGDTNTTNNSAKRSVLLKERPVPVLDVDAIAIDPEAPVTGDRISILANVTNRGTLEAVQTKVTFEVFEGAGGPRLLQNSSPELDIQVGSTKRAMVSWDTTGLAEGNFTITVTTATGGSLSLDVVLSPPPLAEVLITEIIVRPAAPIEGEKVVIEATVTNSGTVTETVEVLFKDGPDDIGGSVRTTVPAGGTATVERSWTAKKGDRTIRVEVVGNPDAVMLKTVKVEPKTSRSCGAFSTILVIFLSIGGLGIVRLGRSEGEGPGPDM